MASGGMEQTYDITTQVISVEQVVKGSKMPFEVALTGGVDKYTGQQIVGDLFLDWKKNIGPKAQAMIGQSQADARVKVKYRPKDDGGFFENKELLDIAPLGGLPPMAQPVAGGTPAQPVMPQQAPQPMTTTTTPAQAPVSASAAPNVVGEMISKQEASEASRTRQGAVRAATEYVGAQAAAGYFENASECDKALEAKILDLTAFVTEGHFREEATAETVTPESVAAEVPGVQVGVPFDTNEGEKEQA